MACRGFLQCLLKLCNLTLALAGALLLVHACSLLAKEEAAPPPPPPAAPAPSLAFAAGKGHAHAGRASQDEGLAGRGELPLQRPQPQGLPARSLGQDWRAGNWHVAGPALQLPRLWFTYLLLGAGGYLTLLTLTGAVAAESNIVCCLCTYQFGLCLLLIAELVAASLVWMEEIPRDPTGEFERTKRLILDNLDICKLAALFLLLAQGSALLLAMMLRAIQADEALAVDEEEDYMVIPRRQLQQPLQRRLNYSQALLPVSERAVSPLGQYGMDPNELQYSAVPQQGSPLHLQPTASVHASSAPGRERGGTEPKPCSIM